MTEIYFFSGFTTLKKKNIKNLTKLSNNFLQNKKIVYKNREEKFKLF